MTAIMRAACLLALGLPISSHALEVRVALIDLPKQVFPTNVYSAGIVATGYNLLPYTLGAGFTITCEFNSQSVESQAKKNFPLGEGKLFIPGPGTQLGSWMADKFHTIPPLSCRVCTMKYRGAAVAATNAVLSGTGATISFAGGIVDTIKTETFKMCTDGANNECDPDGIDDDM